jgi:hypothetical protein
MRYIQRMILVIAHDPLFPHGALRSLLVRRSLAHRTLRLHLGDPIPNDVRRFKAIAWAPGSWRDRSAARCGAQRSRSGGGRAFN